MKKVFLIVAFAAITAGANAQTNFGLQAGANFATQKYEEDEGFDVGTNTGLVIGALASVDFGGSVSFRPELNFIQKGYKVDQDVAKASRKLNYIELSPNFVYNFPTTSGKFFVGAGPSFGFGLGGKYKYQFTGFEEESGDIEMGSDEENDDYKSFDYGINLLAGYQLGNGLFLSGGYNLGLADISHDSENSIKNRAFSVKIGYMFGSKSRSAE